MMGEMQRQPRRRPKPPPADDVPLGAVTITPREIYDAVMRLTTRVETALERGDRTAERVEDHEARIRSLEQHRWPLPSVAIVLSVLGLIVTVLRGG